MRLVRRTKHITGLCLISLFGVSKPASASDSDMLPSRAGPVAGSEDSDFDPFPVYYLGPPNMASSMAVDWEGTLYTLDFPSDYGTELAGQDRLNIRDLPWRETGWKSTDLHAPAIDIVAGGRKAYIEQKASANSSGWTIGIVHKDAPSLDRRYWISRDLLGTMRGLVATKRSGELYVSGSNGIFRAPEASVFDRTTVIEASARVRDPARKVFAGLDTIYATDLNTRFVYRFDPKRNSWSKFYNRVRDLDVDRGGIVYITADDGSTIYRRLPGQSWELVATGFGEDAILSGGRAGELFVTGEEGGDIYRYVDTNENGLEKFKHGHYAPSDVLATEGGLVYRPWAWQGSLQGTEFASAPVAGEGGPSTVSGETPAPALGGFCAASLLFGLGLLGPIRQRRRG